MLIDKEYSKELALQLLKINAVILRPREPFKWSSGWNSPIYCDNRLTLRYPEIRSKIADLFSGYISNNYPETHVISGTATAGIPHAAWVADRLRKPMSYVRGKPKTHGMANQIEGGIQKGEHTILIEDLISTGESAITAADVFDFVGVKVDAILAIFNYGFDHSRQKFTEKNIPLICITDYATLIEVGVEHGFVAQQDLELLGEWRKNPDTWPK